MIDIDLLHRAIKYPMLYIALKAGLHDSALQPPP